jgi:hypothetical protein
MSLFSQSSNAGARFPPPSTGIPLTAANLEAATAAARPTGTSQAASRVNQVRGLAGYVPQAPESPSDVTFRSVEYADKKIPRPADWYSAINANAGRGTVGAGSLFRQGSTYNMNFAQLAAHRRTCFPFTDQPAIIAQRQQQHDQLTGALGSIMGVDAAVASGWATDIQSQYPGPVQQCTLPQRGTQSGIPRSMSQAPVTFIVTMKATPAVLKFLQDSMYGQSQNTAQLKASAPSPSRVHSSPGSTDSKETIGPGHPEYKAAVQMKPPRPGFRNKLRAAAPPPTAISQDAPRDSYSELREQLSQILPAQGNAQRGASSYVPGGQFTLADLAAAQSAAGPSNRTKLMPLHGGTAPTSVHQWLENQGQSCAREYYGPQETMGGLTHGPQPSFVC